MRNLFIFLTAVAFLFGGCEKDLTTSFSDGPTGESGSMAAMVIMGNYMYRLEDGKNIEVFDISKDSTAVKINTVEIGGGLETLFPFKNYLLVGTQSGMLIFDVSDQTKPKYVSIYSHVVSCDPVVAQGNYAYVTLRTGNTCSRGLTQMEIIDISDIFNPKLVKIVDMILPHGLDADGKHLVVCEGDYGFKWFDISDPENPVQNYFETTVPATDVISQGPRFITVGRNGLYQYEYESTKPKLLSYIPVNP